MKQHEKSYYRNTPQSQLSTEEKLKIFASLIVDRLIEEQQQGKLFKRNPYERSGSG